MKTFPLLQATQFSETRPSSEALLGDSHHRILRFCLKPGQTIPEHSSPHSTVVLVVLTGTGVFNGGDGQEVTLAAHDMAVFEPGESHGIRALDQELVFVAILQGVPGEHAPVGSMA